jgi:hypothetical protein
MPKPFLLWFFFLVWLGFELRPLHMQSGILLLEPTPPVHVVWLFWSWGSCELFAQPGPWTANSWSQPLR